MTTTPTRATPSRADAVRLLRHDHALLLDRMAGRPAAALRATYRVADGPLGHFCDSLHDLAAHISMWDEITLAVLQEARGGRRHWSLEPRWETPRAGSALNRGGVDAGRHLPTDLLEHRLRSVLDALVAELESYDEAAWADPATGGPFGASIGALALYATTPPGHAPYVHVAVHLPEELG